MAQDVTWNTTANGDPILSEFKEITTLLRKPVKDKRRIKYTCFDVSPSYIALGSTSGSVYLFARDTCVFQQLIPLSNGAVTHILISPDEKVIALSTGDGNICLVVFKPTVREAVISSKAERNGECITALCWNDNSSELYIGDTNGTVHVMGLSMFTVKRGIFQNPACPIMGLDYKIVQMDFCSPLLLVSTISNCYICDTVQGQYEKVGLRTRQGEFGACFYRPAVGKETDVYAVQQKCSSSNNTEFEEVEIDGNDEQYPRIYCARPGSRLWEAKPNGRIVKTHNFKEALAIPPSIVRKVHETRKSCIESAESNWSPQSLKFSPLCIIANEYLFTYNSNALYILDPVNSVVILWSNEYADISTAKVIDNHIYLMTNSCDFHCLELSPTNLATRNKNTSSNRSSLGLVVVNKKNSEFDKCIKNEAIPNTESECESDNNFLSETKKGVKKCEIEALNGPPNLIEDNVELKETNELFDRTMLDVSCIDISKNKENSSPQTNAKPERIGPGEKLTVSKDEIISLISDVQNIYSLTNSINSSMSENEIVTTVRALQKTLNGVKKSYEKLIEPKPNVFKAIETAEQYYRNIFLSKLSKSQLTNMQSENIFNEMIESFVTINAIDHVKCECGFTYSSKKLLEPKFPDVGLAILERYLKNNKNICISLCKRVPYMWRVYLSREENQEEVFEDETFAQLLQTRDELILSFILHSLNMKQWEFTKNALTNLELEQCLLCNKPLKETNDNERDLSINWNNVANEIAKRKGPELAINFLTMLVTFLPSLSLNKSLFQSLIFTKILNNHGFKQPIDFNQKLNEIPCDTYSSLCCPKVQNQLLYTLEKDLHKPLNRRVFGTHAHHWGMHYDPKNSICPCCTLPLKTPVLLDNNGLSLFRCGHSYHVNCLIQKKILKCNLHH